MRVRPAFLALLFIAGPALWAQDDPPKEEKPQQRPSLGPAPAPSLHGPRASNTVDARKLSRLRKVYVERMDNKLSEKLMNALSQGGRLQIVSDRSEADAVMHGTCLDSRRLKTVRTEVYINDRASGDSIWQDSVRRPYNPPPLDKAVAETATLILEHLRESIQEAERH
ncbi:MAG: hypothetical protein HYS61_00940 [Acidobacteria bacterium]|nr:hypothetical protein [Acidobacteriota bacterium]